MATSKDVDAMRESEFLALATRTMNQITDSIHDVIEQQQEINAELTGLLVDLGGSPPKPSLTLVEGDDA
jgi:hypothetical protein